MSSLPAYDRVLRRRTRGQRSLRGPCCNYLSVGLLQGGWCRSLPEEAESYGAVWEDDELVTYDLQALKRMFQMDEYQREETGCRPDND